MNTGEFYGWRDSGGEAAKSLLTDVLLYKDEQESREIFKRLFEINPMTDVNICNFFRSELAKRIGTSTKFNQDFGSMRIGHPQNSFQSMMEALKHDTAPPRNGPSPPPSADCIGC